jgi:hypothetical protein|tara:strand:+ start:140 stop:697 length:558 start_codon:yes stop_codon:yes gene_type:complete
MAKRVTDLTALTVTPAADDVLVIVDKNDTSSGADGTSKKIDNKFFIQTDKVTINNSDFTDLNSDGKELLASPGSGFAIIPINIYIEQTKGGTPNEDTMGITIGHVNKESDYYWSTNRYWPKTPSSGTAFDGFACDFTGASQSGKGICNSSIEDKGLFIYAKDGGPSTNATNTMEVWVTYRIIDIS